MSRRIAVRLFPILALAMLAACGASQSRRPAAPPEGAEIVVDNRAFSDMTIYAIEGSSRRRLGFAPGNSKTTLQVPASMANRDIQLLADPVGSSRTSVSNRVYLRVGERVTLTIPP